MRMNPKDHPTRIGEENKYEDSVFFRQISVNMVFPENMTSRPKTNERTEASQKIENLPNELKKRLCKNCGRVYNQCKCKNPPPSTPLRCWSRKKEANQRKLDPNAVIRETIKKTQPDPIDKKCTGYVKSPKITKKRKETNDGEKIEVIEDEKPLSEVEVEAAPKKKKIITRNKSPKISIESSPKVDDVSKKTEEIFKANDKPKTAQSKKAKVLPHKNDQKVETARKTSSSKDVRQTVTPQNVADFVKKMTSLNEPAKIPTEDQQAMKPFLENIRAMDKKTRETFLNNLSSETRLSIISILSKTSDLAVLPKFTEASIFSEKISEFKYLASLEEIKNVQVAPEIESMPTKDDVESTTKTLPPDLESNSSEIAKNLAESDLVIPSVSSPRPSNLTEATRKEEIIEKSSIEDEQPRETLDNITMDMDDAVNPNMSSLDPNDSSSVVENTQSLPSTIQPKSEQTSTISNQNLIKVRNDLMAPSSKGTIEDELFSKKSERSDNKGSTSPREKLSDCRCKRKLTMTSYRNKPGRKSKASDLVYKIVCVPSNAKIEKSAALSEKNRIKIAKCTQTGGTFEQDFIASFVAKCASNEITPTPPKFFINTMFGDKSERKLNVRRHKNGLLTRPRYSVSLRPLVRSLEMMKTYNKANQTLAFARLNNFYPWASLVNYSVCPVSIVNDKKLPLGQQQTLRTKLALDLNKLRESHGMNKTTCGSPERKENQTCAKASSDHFEECIPQKICLAMQTDPENQVCISITPVQTDPCSVEHCIRKLVHILNEDPKTSGKIQVPDTSKLSERKPQSAPLPISKPPRRSKVAESLKKQTEWPRSASLPYSEALRPTEVGTRTVSICEEQSEKPQPEDLSPSQSYSLSFGLDPDVESYKSESRRSASTRKSIQEQIESYQQSIKSAATYQQSNRPITSCQQSLKSHLTYQQSNKSTSSYQQSIKPTASCPQSIKSVASCQKSIKSTSSYQESIKLKASYPPSIKSTATYQQSFKPIASYQPSIKSTATYQQSNQPIKSYPQSIKSAATYQQSNQPIESYPQSIKSAGTYQQSNQPIESYPQSIKSGATYQQSNQPIKSYPQSIKSNVTYQQSIKPIASCQPSIKSTATYQQIFKPIASCHPSIKSAGTYQRSNQPIESYPQSIKSAATYQQSIKSNVTYQQSIKPIASCQQSIKSAPTYQPSIKSTASCQHSIKSTASDQQSIKSSASCKQSIKTASNYSQHSLSRRSAVPSCHSRNPTLHSQLSAEEILSLLKYSRDSKYFSQQSKALPSDYSQGIGAICSEKSAKKSIPAGSLNYLPPFTPIICSQKSSCSTRPSAASGRRSTCPQSYAPSLKTPTVSKKSDAESIISVESQKSCAKSCKSVASGKKSCAETEISVRSAKKSCTESYISVGTGKKSVLTEEIEYNKSEITQTEIQEVQVESSIVPREPSAPTITEEVKVDDKKPSRSLQLNMPIHCNITTCKIRTEETKCRSTSMGMFDESKKTKLCRECKPPSIEPIARPTCQKPVIPCQNTEECSKIKDIKPTRSHSLPTFRSCKSKLIKENFGPKGPTMIRPVLQSCSQCKVERKYSPLNFTAMRKDSTCQKPSCKPPKQTNEHKTVCGNRSKKLCNVWSNKEKAPPIPILPRKLGCPKINKQLEKPEILKETACSAPQSKYSPILIINDESKDEKCEESCVDVCTSIGDLLRTGGPLKAKLCIAVPKTPKKQRPLSRVSCGTNTMDPSPCTKKYTGKSCNEAQTNDPTKILKQFTPEIMNQLTSKLRPQDEQRVVCVKRSKIAKTFIHELEARFSQKMRPVCELKIEKITPVKRKDSKVAICAGADKQIREMTKALSANKNFERMLTVLDLDKVSSKNIKLTSFKLIQNDYNQLSYALEKYLNLSKKR